MLTVRLVVFFHEYKRVVLDVAEVLDVRPSSWSGSFKQGGNKLD